MPVLVAKGPAPGRGSMRLKACPKNRLTIASRRSARLRTGTPRKST